MAYLISLVLILEGAAIAAYFAARAVADTSGRAVQLKLASKGILIASAFVGLGTCIRLLLTINGKM